MVCRLRKRLPSSDLSSICSIRLSLMVVSLIIVCFSPLPSSEPISRGGWKRRRILRWPCLRAVLHAAGCFCFQPPPAGLEYGCQVGPMPRRWGSWVQRTRQTMRGGPKPSGREQAGLVFDGIDGDAAAKGLCCIREATEIVEH